MAPSIYRFMRFMRDKACFLTTAVVGFSFLLTWIFVLYQPSPGPGELMQMGWQSWGLVDMNMTVKPGSSQDLNIGDDEEVPEGTNWWEVDAQKAPEIDSASLPLDKWTPLLPHDTVSEIALVRCYINPRVAPDMCQPDSTSEQDAIKGKWVRVNMNLNVEAGYFAGYLNLYYRRTRRQDINLIDSIQLLGDNTQPENDDGNWKKVEMSLRAGIRGAPHLYLWYHLGKTSADMTQEDRANLITELDILYGEDVPWYGFEKLEPPTTPYTEHKYEAIHLSIRRGVKRPPKAAAPHFSHDGRYKILQVADLHYSVSQGVCKSVDIPDCHHSDNMTNTLISHVLDEEEPDLVVFTGDQLNGQGTSWNPKSVLAKFAKALTERERPVPWAAVFGNHDEESGYAGKEEQVELMKALPYNLVDKGPSDIHGVGNYLLKIRSADTSRTHLLTLYFLDSGSYSKGFYNWWGIFTPTAFDWIRESQTNWFLQESAAIKHIERPFRPSKRRTLEDDITRSHKRDRERSALPQQVTPQDRRQAKPNALMFFHIPLPEAYSEPDYDPQTGKALDYGTHGQEKPGNAKNSDGFFEKGILQAKESLHESQGGKLEIKAVGNGHCHITDNCRRVKGIWFCFGGGGSYSGYGKDGFDRRFRVYDVSDYGELIRTYKRTEKDEIIDQMVIAGRGAAGI